MGNRMTKANLGALAVLVLLIGLTGYVGTQYPKALPPVLVPAPTVPDWGYAVGPGWQMTPTPMAQAQALPPGTPTPVWMQPNEVGGCDRLKQIAEAAMNYRCETLWASELTEPHILLGRKTEPGAQLTRIHEFGTSQGTLYYILFEQALFVWKTGDARIVVASPVNGCWQGL